MGRHVEKFLLYWLDENMDTSDHNRRIRKELRSIINHCETFDGLPLCQERIQTSEDKQLILIVSGRLALQIIPEIHHLQHLSAIYIYCMNKDTYIHLINQYSKVKDVINDENELLDRIESDKIRRVQFESEISYNIYVNINEPSPSTSRLQEHFIHSLILIDSLLRLDDSLKQDKNFKLTCEKSLKHYKIQSKMIKTFDNYIAKKALWWYTRDTFLYEKIYNALLEENIDEMLSCRSVIRAMYDQLKQNQYQSSIRLYYAKIMNIREVEYLKQSVNGLLSLTNFLSTNSNCAKVQQVINNRKIGYYDCRVLFSINVQNDVKARKPFAAIDKLSGFIEEGEFLFMIGSIFRLIDVDIKIIHETMYTRDTVVTVQMELCSEKDPQVQSIYESVARIVGNPDENETINYQTLGDIFRKSGKFDSAEKVYLELTDRLHGPSLRQVYYLLAMIKKETNEHAESIEWCGKALEIQRKTDPNNFIDIGDLYDLIGAAYFRNENNDRALDFYKKARDCFRLAHSPDHQHMAHIYSNIGSVYRRQEKYPKALENYEKALAIDERLSLSNRFHVAKTLSEIANVYYYLNNYQKALEYYQKALQIRREALSPRDKSLADIYQNMGDVYRKMKNLQEALCSYQEAVTIYKRSGLPFQRDLNRIYDEIESITREMKS
ncbi:hypothetical protein I4U23_029729 [Adineta vaga]|nr:hypothetical protein I4U23_029729 [Adineta vaga]